MVKNSLLCYYGLQIYISLLISIVDEALRLILTSVESLEVWWATKKSSTGKEGSFLERAKALTVQYKKDRSVTTSSTTSTTSLWTSALCSFMFIDSDLASYWSSIVWLYEPCLFWQFKIKVYIKWRSMQGVKCEGDVGIGFLFKQKVFVEQHIFLCHRWWLKGDKIKFPLMKDCYFSSLFVQN